MDYLYSLYDALVSIHVPNDKARAVVDAMERDMGTTIATKADLQLLRQEMATKADLAGLRQEFALLRKDVEMLSAGVLKDLDTLSNGFRKDLDGQSNGFRKDVETQSNIFHKAMETQSSCFHKDLEILSTTMTVRLGSMLMLGLGLLFAALKLT